MALWIVVEYEDVDVTQFAGGREVVPGRPRHTFPVEADSWDEALALVADGPGWYSAFAPDSLGSQVELVLRPVDDDA